MPALMKVKDKETGEVLHRYSVDAAEIVKSDPARYKLMGLVKDGEKPKSVEAAGAEPGDDDDTPPAKPAKKS